MPHDRKDRLRAGTRVEVPIPGLPAPLRLIAGHSDLIASELAINGYPSFEA